MTLTLDRCSNLFLIITTDYDDDDIFSGSPRSWNEIGDVSMEAHCPHAAKEQDWTHV